MEVKGRIFQILEPITGQSAKGGTWKKQDFVIETLDDQYPKKVCFSNWNDKIQLEALSADNILTVQFDAESREYNGKWYTNLTAWKADSESAATADNGIPVAPPIEVDQSDDSKLPF